jgi:hypothetical protein
MQIYKTTNLLNSKIYIGKNITNNNFYIGSGILLNRAIKKYGKENFIKEIIDTAETIEELNEKEKIWIAFYNSQNRDIGYNIAAGGDGGDTLSKHPNLDKLRHKFANGKRKGMPMPKKENSAKWINLDIEKVVYMYTVENMSLTKIGKEFNTSKNKISRTLLDQGITLRSRTESCLLRNKPSEETRQKMSDSHKGEKNGMKGKSVYQRWVELYGKEIADEKMAVYKENMSESLKDSGFNKGNKHYSKK